MFCLLQKIATPRLSAHHPFRNLSRLLRSTLRRLQIALSNQPDTELTHRGCWTSRPSVDCSPASEASQLCFASVQNKLHRATHALTAAEIIFERAGAAQRFRD